jgi:small conductance mechanosensitive channel
MPYVRFRLPVLVLLLLLGLACPVAARAADAAGPTTSDLNSLVQTLQDPGQRQVLIGDIKTLIALRAAHHPANAPPREGPGGALVTALSGAALRIGAAVTALATLSPLTDLSAWARQIATDQPLRLLWARGAGLVLLLLGAALLAGHGTRAALNRPLRRLHEAARGPVWLRVLGLGGALLLGWVPVLVLLAVGYAALAIAQAAGGIPAPARDLVLAVLNACALVRAIGAVVEALLVPGASGSHFVPLSEETADYWLVWSRRLTRFVVYGWFALGFAFDAGMNGTAYEVVLKAFGLMLTGLLIMLILQNRAALADVLHGPNGREAAGLGRLRAMLGNGWHIAAILYLLGTYGVWAFDVPGGFAFLVRATLLSLVILALARIADAVGTSLVNRLLAVAPDLEQRLPGLQKRVNLYGPLLTGTGRLLVYMLAALLVLQAWGINIRAGLETEAGQRLIGGLVTICFTAAIALAIWEAVSMSTELYLARPGPDGTPVERSGRTRTLLPLFRKTLAILLGVAVILISLATLGVNIGPLLAGAGIAGIAIGFGAQSLVKDVITGMFVLMQDAVAVGDVVSVAGNSGLVEQISIRSIRLRDQSGTVIIIPFSEVTTVQNMTKDFSYALFSIGIAYREDVDEVIAVITALADDLQKDPEYATLILEPIEVLGLDRFADSAVIVKARIKTRPIQQWSVMREFNRRMKRRFDELNIEMPFPHQTIYFGTDREGKAPPAHLRMEPGSARQTETAPSPPG